MEHAIEILPVIEWADVTYFIRQPNEHMPLRCQRENQTYCLAFDTNEKARQWLHESGNYELDLLSMNKPNTIATLETLKRAGVDHVWLNMTVSPGIPQFHNVEDVIQVLTHPRK